MRNLLFAILATSTLLFQSCTLEESLSVGFALLDASSGHGTYTSGSSGGSTSSGSGYHGVKDPLSRNWSIENNNFENPILHKESIIYFGNGLHSINKYSGLENWSLDLGYISTFIKPIVIEDLLYFVDSDILYIVNVEDGRLLQNYNWKGGENIRREFSIHDNQIYVIVSDDQLTYSAIASININGIDEGPWTYHRLVHSNEQNGEFDSISKCIIKKNEIGDLLLLTVVERGDSSNSNSTETQWVEAYNMSQEEVEWIVDQVPSHLIGNQFFLQDENLVVRGINFMLNLNSNTGVENWLQQTGAHSYDLTNSDRIFFYNEIVMLINDNQLITAWDLKTGTQKWELNENQYANYNDFESVGKGTVNIIENKMYYLSGHSILIGVDLETGQYETPLESLQFEGGLIAVNPFTLVGHPKFTIKKELVSFNVDF